MLQNLNNRPVEVFLKKIATLPNWNKNILKRLVKYGLSCVKETQISDIILLAKKENELLNKEQIHKTEIIEKEDLPEDINSSDEVFLYKISNIENVDALSKNGIEFSKDNKTKLTIVYGRNGSGKSGIVRILKQISAFRVMEKCEILPNVIRCSNIISKADININDKVFEWNKNSETNEYSRKIRIFDTKNAAMYIDGEKSGKTEIIYTPYIFSLLEQLCTVLSEVKNSIELEITKYSNDNNTINEEFTKNNISINIDEETEDSYINNLIQWDEEKEKKLSELTEIFEKPKELALKKELLNKSLEQSKNLILEIEKCCSIENIKKYFINLEDKNNYNKALEKLKKNTEENNPITGVCSTEWEILWNSAKSFVKSINSQSIIKLDKCVLCMQSLDDSAKIRMNKFNDWIENDIKKNLEECEKNLKIQEDLIDKLKTSIDIPNTIKDSLENEQELKNIFELFVNNAKHNYEKISEDCKNFEANKANPFYESNYKNVAILDNLENFLKNNERTIANLRGGKQEESKIKEYGKLKANLFYKENEDKIRKLKDNDAIIKKLKRITTECQTRSITNIRKELDTQFITGRLEDLVKKERKFFELHYDIGLRFSNNASKCYQSLKTSEIKDDRYNIEKILSEGERKIVALSCFLAEYSISGGKIPLIFDDPVNSLDDNYRTKIEKRLIELAKDTQVIIFTHNFLFFNNLRNLAIKEGVSHNEIFLKKDKNDTGVTFDGDWNNKKIPNKIEYIREELKKLNSSNHDEIRKLGGMIRQIWEQAIEEKLFNGAITRFNKEIKTRSIQDIIIDESIYPMIDSGMSKTSQWADHWQCPVDNSIVCISDVEKELDNIENFIKIVKQKQQKINNEKIKII